MSTRDCRAALKPFLLKAIQDVKFCMPKEHEDPFVEFACARFSELQPKYPVGFVEPPYFVPLIGKITENLYN